MNKEIEKNTEIVFETICGTEEHSSSWVKFLVKDVPLIREDHEQNRNDRHYLRQYKVATKLPEFFTVWVQDGTRRGPQYTAYYVCQRRDDIISQITGANGFYARGNFDIVAFGDTKIKATRLLSWWTDARNPKTPQFTQLMAEYLDKRGVVDIYSVVTI